MARRRRPDSGAQGEGGGREEGKRGRRWGRSIALPISSWGGAERRGDGSKRRRAEAAAAAMLQGRGGGAWRLCGFVKGWGAWSAYL